MSAEQFEHLKQRVRDFVKSQPGYNADEHKDLDAFCEDKNTFGVIYGENIAIGIAGFGETADLAFKDFVRSWKELKGFERFRNNKSRFGR
jgi:hypothetical protein